MRWLVAGLLLVSSAALAEEDPRDVFGLGKKKQPEDPRDVFGLNKKPKQEAPLDCSDGTAFGCTGPSDPLDERASPYTLATWLPARYLLRLPVASATHDSVAHYALGAGRDEAGPFFAGASGLENRWLVGGAPGDGLRTGAADTQIPLAFLDGMWVTAGGFTARDRASTGGVIDARLRGGTKDHEVEARAWAGWTAKARQRAILPGSYFVRRGQVDAGPDAAAAIVATGPLGESAWYAAGIAPELNTTKFTWRTARVLDADGDRLPDGFPGIIELDPIGEFTQTPITWRVPLMLRAGIDRGVHHADVTLLGSAANDVRYLFNATLQAAGVDGTSFVGDAIATWRGVWTNTRARGQLAWHRSMRRESARDPAAAGIPQLLSAYVPDMLAEDPELAAACRREGPLPDPPPLPHCPVPVSWFRSGGAGELTDTTGDRPSLTADIAHRIGNNVVRAGATGEDTRLVHEAHYTGGVLIRSLAPGITSERRFADPDQPCSTDAMQPCPTVDMSVLRYRTRYTAAYVEDTWHAAPNIAVNGGMRWELMWVGTALHHSNQLSPRLGMSWDFLGGGRSRVWTSMGRSYAHLTAGLGPLILRDQRTVDRVVFPSGEGRSIQSGAPIPVAPGISPITQDELTAGAQIAVARAVRLTTWLQGRWLERGIEDVAGRLDNPGRDGSIGAIRETGIFAAELATSPTAKLVLRAGYMYGRSVGTWTGPFDPRQGDILYGGSDFDNPPINTLGRLPTDLGHRTYVEAERTGTIGSMKLAVALRLTAGSGRPRNVVDASGAYLLPRGSVGRGPVISQANTRVTAFWRGLDITLDLFNVFGRREALSIDEVYTEGFVQPIDQGTRADLVFLKNEDGSEASRRAGYAHATSYQAPLSVVLGVHHAF